MWHAKLMLIDYNFEMIYEGMENHQESEISHFTTSQKHHLNIRASEED